MLPWLDRDTPFPPLETALQAPNAGARVYGRRDDTLVRELADSMLLGSTPSVGLHEGVTSAVTCFAIDDAMNRGQVVDVAPYWQTVGVAQAA